MRLGDQLVHVLAGEDERRRNDHGVTHSAHDQPFAEAVVPAKGAHRPALREEAPGGFVCHQLQRTNHADAARLADQGVVRQFAPARLQVGPDLLAATVHQVFVAQDGNVGQRRRTHRGMARIGVAVRKLAAVVDEHVRDRVRHHDGP